MAKKKREVRFNVISLRVSEEEKTVLDEITRRKRTTISHLMREAMQRYVQKAKA